MNTEFKNSLLRSHKTYDIPNQERGKETLGKSSPWFTD